MCWLSSHPFLACSFACACQVKGAEGEESSLELRRCKLLRMGTAVMAFGPVSVHLAGCELQVWARSWLSRF